MKVGDTFWIATKEHEWGGNIEFSELIVPERSLAMECLATGWTVLEATVTREVTLEMKEV